MKGLGALKVSGFTISQRLGRGAEVRVLAVLHLLAVTRQPSELEPPLPV